MGLKIINICLKLKMLRRLEHEGPDGPGGPQPMMYNYPKQYDMCMTNVELFKDEKCD